MKNQYVLNSWKNLNTKFKKIQIVVSKPFMFFVCTILIFSIFGCKNANKEFAEAYSNSDTVKMLALIKTGANINTQNENQETPLHIECKKCIQLEKMYFQLKNSQMLLSDDDLSSDIKEVDKKWKENINMIAFLLENKADLDIKNEDGKSPYNLVDEAKSTFCLGLISAYKLRQALEKNKTENK